jgi:Ca-activated chloride channel family protein
MFAQSVWNHPVFRVLLMAATLMVPIAHAQGQSVDTPHIVPRHDTQISSYMPVEVTLSALRPRPMRVDVNVVLVPVTVVDSTSRPVIDLPQQNFSLLEGGVPQKIQFFSREDAPISVALILDFSGSMGDKIEYERQAVEQFFQNANPADDYFVIAVSDRPTLVAESLQSIDAIENQLASTEPRGMTALYDSIYLGVNKLRTARYKRRAMVIVSDGGDNHSRYNLKEIKSVLAESDVLTYSIGIFDDIPIPLFKTIEERLGRKWLDDLTRVSGGRDIPADDRKQIPVIAALISREMRSQYVLGYRPADPNYDGKWRKISVKLAENAGHMHVHFKEGYVAPGPQGHCLGPAPVTPSRDPAHGAGSRIAFTWRRTLAADKPTPLSARSSLITFLADASSRRSREGCSALR